MSNGTMVHKRVWRHSATILAATFSILLGLPTIAAGENFDPTIGLDHGLDLFEDQRYLNAETALLKLVGNSSFRRLDNSQRSLAYSHIAYSKINRGKERDSLRYIDNALAETKREFGKRSVPYLNHMETKAMALYWADDRRGAARIGESMLDIIERMGDDYRKEEKQVRRMISRMRKVELEEGDLPLDKSDFYTKCESIHGLTSLNKAHAIMGDYKLVGTDIKPKYKKSQYFKNTYLKNSRESSNDRKSRLIYVPDKKHLDDWCVIYPAGRQVNRVIISASSDR